MNKIAEWRSDTKTALELRDQLAELDHPVVIRQLVADWKIVELARQSTEQAVQMLIDLDSHAPAYTVVGDPQIQGRFFYDDTLQGVNFKKINAAVTATLEQLVRLASSTNPHAVSIQAASVTETFPGFHKQHPNPLLPPDIEPTIWISNRSRVAPHYDLNHNIACVTTGQRTFTLFPPAQISNLYIGPILSAPGGVPISMVDIKAPDFDRFPKYHEALKHAQSATLEPGDAIYIPSPWWHAVESLDPLNVLVNYWWNPSLATNAPSAGNSLMLAMLAIRSMDASQRQAWRQFFDYLVFKSDGAPEEYLPDELDDLITGLSDEKTRQCFAFLRDVLIDSARN